MGRSPDPLLERNRVGVTVERMARKKPTADQVPTPIQGTETVRIDRDLSRKLTIIAIRRGISVAELISPHLRPWVEDLYRKTVGEMASEL